MIRSHSRQLGYSIVSFTPVARLSTHQCLGCILSTRPSWAYQLLRCCHYHNASASKPQCVMNFVKSTWRQSTSEPSLDMSPSEVF